MTTVHGEPGRVPAVPVVSTGRLGLARVLSPAIVIVVAAALLVAAISNENFQWDVVARYFLSGGILTGLLTTLALTAVSMLIGTALGGVLAIMRLSRHPVTNAAANAYIWFFRGVPLLVQLVFVYNISALYPQLDLNDWLTPNVVAVLAFSLHEAAYMAEIIRSGILSVPKGQHEAASALGMSPWTITRRIVLPQAMRVILPPTANQVISMLKSTSLVSVIAVPDLLYSAQLIYSRSFQTIPLLMVATIWYLIVVSVLSVLQNRIERRVGRGFTRSPQRVSKTSGRGGAA